MFTVKNPENQYQLVIPQAVATVENTTVRHQRAIPERNGNPSVSEKYDVTAEVSIFASVEAYESGAAPITQLSKTLPFSGYPTLDALESALISKIENAEAL
jgi:hypothetical protein